MRIRAVNVLNGGEILAEPVVTEKNEILIPKGTVLKEEYIPLIKSLGVESLMLEDPYENYEDLYFVRYGRYGDTYIQSGYLQYLEFVDDGLHDDHIFCRDILLRILELYDLPSNEKNSIRKTIKIIEEILDHEEGYIPELNSLKDIKQDYDPYIYNSKLKRE